MIEVFKTNVQEVAQSKIIRAKLPEHFPNGIINFDLEDWHNKLPESSNQRYC